MSTPENCTHDCGSCSAACNSRTMDPSQFQEKLSPESSVKKVIGVVSGKGGVGKSLVTSLDGLPDEGKKLSCGNP